MPLYTYMCLDCERTWDVLKKIADLNRPEICEACLAEGMRRVAAPRVVPDYSGYNCPITGNWIEGRRAHQENLARHDCRVYEPGEREENQRRRAAADAALDAAVEDSVGRAIEAMPARKREQLAVELESGADITVERK